MQRYPLKELHHLAERCVASTEDGLLLADSDLIAIGRHSALDPQQSANRLCSLPQHTQLTPPAPSAQRCALWRHSRRLPSLAGRGGKEPAVADPPVCLSDDGALNDACCSA